MVSLQLPDDIYQWAQQQAQQNQTSVQEVLIAFITRLKESMPLLPVDEETELAALRYLSDDALWTIARDTMPEPQQTRLQFLMDKNSSGEIDETEFTELTSLVERGQQRTLRKSEAMALLAERGYTVSLSVPERD